MNKLSIVGWRLFIVSVGLGSGALGFSAMDKLLNPKTIEEPVSIKDTDTEITNTPCVTCAYITNDNKEYSYKTNPILTVSLYKDTELIGEYKTISGRWNTQTLNRNAADNSSPSPNGTYTILPETAGFDPETGGVFLPYEPTFETERSHLGFHQDPSWGLDNNEDGTRGCQAFKTLEEYNSFVNKVKTNKITTLIIDYE